MNETQIREAIAKAALEAGHEDVETAVSTLAPRAVTTSNPDGTAGVMVRTTGGAVESVADAVAGLSTKPQPAPPIANLSTDAYQAAQKAARSSGARRRL